MNTWEEGSLGLGRGALSPVIMRGAEWWLLAHQLFFSCSLSCLSACAASLQCQHPSGDRAGHPVEC